ncbi:MAG: 5'/3'-nucleotidase SurE [Neisseriaceae bacterium]|nr:5'/3'-nucleotidase SurE [Neisseriaceae bacterium]
MNILISNDDGYQSYGLSLLARISAEFANVRVVAPDRDRSAVSNSLTLDRPLYIREAANGFFYVNGTPSDCVHLALQVMDDFKPDWVFSGINHGANMGDDTLYSGTVAAATEGFLLDIPAVSFSLNDKSNRFWNTAEKAVFDMVKSIINYKPLKPCLWNVNIPRVAADALQGIKVTRLGRRHHGQGVMKSSDPNGNPVYWIGAIGKSADTGEGTDFRGSEEGFVTITPLTVDLTSHAEIDVLNNLLLNSKL